MEDAIGLLFALVIGVIPFLFMTVMMAFAVTVFVFWLWMLVDCLKREQVGTGKDDKLLWLLLIVLGGWLGALVYYIIIKRGNGTTSPTSSTPTQSQN